MGEVTSLDLDRAGAISPPRPIAPDDVLDGFRCGKEPLDEWLIKHALKADGRSARTYVVTAAGRVVGYYCLSSGAVRHTDVSGKIRRNTPDPIPVMIIGRLAVDLEYRGRGFGPGLLKDGLARILEAARIVGCRAAMIHAIDDEATAFYLKYGFIEYPGGSRSLYLPIETILDAIA